jgi:DNA-binding MarR family transcriptional regulator
MSSSQALETVAYGTGPLSNDHHPADGETRFVSALLNHVEREAHVSQRQLAAELGIALGLVNIYMKRCVKKGLIKVQQVPSRRYAYFLTPTGFVEKTRLATEFLTWSLSFFRRARGECSNLMIDAKKRGWTTLALSGGSDLAEIAVLCATEQGLHVCAMVDVGMTRPNVLGVPVFSSLELAMPRPDGWMITGIQNAQALHDAAVAYAGADNVLTPPMLSVRKAMPSEGRRP